MFANAKPMGSREVSHTNVAAFFGMAVMISAGFLSSACSSGPGIAPEHPDITGTWVVNLERSDRPGDGLEREQPRGTPPGRRPQTGGEVRERFQRGFALLLQNSVAFRIEEGDSTLTITGAEGIERVIHPDGKERNRRIEGLGNVRVKARWKGEKLVVERTLETGVKITETFELVQEGRQLSITLELSGARQGFEFRRIYDPGQEGS